MSEAPAFSHEQQLAAVAVFHEFPELLHRVPEIVVKESAMLFVYQDGYDAVVLHILPDATADVCSVGAPASRAYEQLGMLCCRLGVSFEAAGLDSDPIEKAWLALMRADAKRVWEY